MIVSQMKPTELNHEGIEGFLNELSSELRRPMPVTDKCKDLEKQFESMMDAMQQKVNEVDLMWEQMEWKQKYIGQRMKEIETRQMIFYLKVESGGNRGIFFTTHPEINEVPFESDNILGPNDEYDSFPISQSEDGADLLSWSGEIKDESVLPMRIAGLMYQQTRLVSESSMKLHQCLNF